MQGLKKCHKRRGLRRTQILSVGGHVAASLNHLADQLVLCQPHRNTIQSGASLPALLSKGMAVSALLGLKDERALPLKCSCAMYESLRHRITTPGVHVRAPGREPG